MKISFDAFIEIPKGSRNKYEFDKKNNSIRLDRVLYSSIIYPTDYGFIPKTLSKDGDPLDILVFLTVPTIPGCLIKVKPIGIFFMNDENGEDEKIIGVPISDPNYNTINDIDEISFHAKKEIEHFFLVYKDLENKKVIIGDWKNQKEAIYVYKESRLRYQKKL
ncbi:MAG: inorganic diphosphatase [Flavobacteriales bacterium]|jgi:inorganic pyrophosphatase|uniref:inorganic diphosphatase n=1 Tax=Blattabacterium sp. (Mastotermes darwiniensis) TaxID=39768 RepID=UPI000231DF30|nr:inorganic diphosphatase [Blattabacterium sp. (Mastotermes darwiniensis)]AER40333.1 inorganic diphosphatase [Blattabacterium sp. (Mastotermes darwiniensis) str. MADAR]MDR1804720.1 inorganic diphosphatase [Flavobacteriales bacterium]